MRKIGYKGMIAKFVNCLLQNVEKLIIGIFRKLWVSRVCGNPVCKLCSSKLINDKRSCDLCFMRVKMVD